MEPSRTREIIALRSEGYSLAAIGRRFGVSRQRVDQIIRRAGGVEVDREARRARRAQEADARRERHARLARERSGEILEAYRGGLDPNVIARDLGLVREAVGGLIGGWRTEADRAARAKALQRAAGPKYSDAQLARGIRLVADRVGRAPTRKEYDRVARGLGLPSLATVHTRFGGWHEAVRTAGLQPSVGDRVWAPRWPLSACWRALESVADQLGDPPRHRAYATLAAGRDDLPSPVTVRQRLGLWSDIAAALVERGGGDGRQRPLDVNARALARADRPVRPSLPSQPAVRALRYLAEHPGSSATAVGRGLGIRHDSHTRALLARLERDGRLTQAPNGGSRAWTLTDRGHRLLHELPEGVYV